MRPLADYPSAWGAQRASVFPHAGPASYTQITPGTPPAPATGGDSVLPVEAGMKFFDQVQGNVTDSGNFSVLAIPTQPSSTSSTGPLSGQQCTAYTLLWIALVTGVIGGQAQVAGTEAAATTDLSDEVVRLTAIGPK